MKDRQKMKEGRKEEKIIKIGEEERQTETWKDGWMLAKSNKRPAKLWDTNIA